MNVRPASSIRRDLPRFIGPCPSPGRNDSTSVSAESELRRTLRQHIDPRPRPGWNPSVNFRLPSRLRRTLPRTIASHRSPAKPSTKHQGRSLAPKSLFATRQLEIELRVEPSDRRQSHFQVPKNPSATPRPAIQPRGTFPQASEPPPGSEEPISGASTRFPAPGGTFPRASGQPPGSEEPINQSSTRFPAPWNLPTSVRATSRLRRTLPQHLDPLSGPVEPSDSLRTTSGLRRTHQRSVDSLPAPGGTLHRASGQPPVSEETINRSSTRIQAPGGEHHQASRPPRGSEEPVSDK
jgi:hypothetical protein